MADHRGLAIAGQAHLPGCIDPEVLPAHEHMFARWEAERRSADPRLAELDAEVHGATGCRLGELELHAAVGALAVALDDVGPARGDDDVVEAQEPGGVVAHPDTAGALGVFDRTQAALWAQ